jgi:putative ABC transport system permease protein
MLGKVLAANLGKHVGDPLEIYAEPCEVVGIFESFSVYENGAVFMLLSELQRLMDRPRKLTGFVVQAEPTGDRSVVEDLKRRIEKLDPTLNAVDTAEFVHGISQIRVTQAAAWVTSAVATIVGIIGVLNTMVMSVFERAREIGTLRAIGWRKGRIIRLILCEALMISSVAAVLGVAIGVVAVRIIGSVPALSGLVEGSVPLRAVMAGCVMALTVGLLGAIYPAYWAANLWPVQALRRR